MHYADAVRAAMVAGPASAAGLRES
jgi:hypothetical protein